MKIYNEPIALQSAKPRELFNITTRVKAAMEKSGFRDGIILVSSLQPNAAVIVNEEEPGFLDNLNGWLDQLAPGREVAACAGKPARPFDASSGDCLFYGGPPRSWGGASHPFRGTRGTASEARRRKGDRRMKGCLCRPLLPGRQHDSFRLIETCTESRAR
jgi:hypothetical protein